MSALIVSKRYPEDCVGATYVGRPTRFGNPYKVGKDGSVSEVLAKYAAWLFDDAQAELRRSLQFFRGKKLSCWCAPRGGIAPDDERQICHAQILARLANEGAA